jgi:branched-chain amino acid transport system substrate-binding protein
MRSFKLAAAGCLVASLSLAACGGDDTEGAPAGQSASGGKALTIYSSLPLQGASRVQAEAVVDGAKLALEQKGGKAGPHTIKYVSLDDSTAQAGAWTPEAESANALKASQDESTIIYLGTLNSGAAKVSIPILNEAQIPMVSPANTYVGLTSDEPGSEAGEPEKYYPTGERTYARVAPRDSIQGAAMVTLMKAEGCTKVAMTNDKEVYGAGLARVIEMAAKQQGLTLTGNNAIDKNASNYRALAAQAKGAGADCYVYAGITANNAVQQFKDFAAALGPDARLYGPDGVCDGGFANEQDGGIPANVAVQVKCTVPTLTPEEYPPAGQEFFKTYQEKYGHTADPYAIYGYEAMSLALDAIERSETGERADVLKAILATKDRDSVLGVYSIDANGDTSLGTYGAYTIKDNKLVFDQAIEAAGQ